MARAVASYLLVALATVVGIFGMGLVFTALTDGPRSLVLMGLPMLLVGLYWSGRALGQSLQAGQARRHRDPGPYLADQVGNPEVRSGAGHDAPGG